jgi:plasmid replication initiation protein
MKKFTFWRNTIVCEYHEVEAETEEQARDMMYDIGDPVRTEWIDWATDGFELEHVEELDPLYRMVKDYQMSEDEKDQIRNSVVPKLINGSISVDSLDV